MKEDKMEALKQILIDLTFHKQGLFEILKAIESLNIIHDLSYEAIKDIAGACQKIAVLHGKFEA